MGKSKSKKKLSNKKAVIWSLIILAIIISIIAFKNYDSKSEYPDQQEQVAENTRNCETWIKRYPVVTYNQFPNGTLNVEKGETWVIKLDQNKWSGTVNFNYRYFNIRPANSIQILLPNGLVIEDNPQKDIHLQNKNGFKFKGKTCVMVSN